MLRLTACALLLASPAAAWEFTPTPVCTLSQTGAVDIVLTYDPMLPEYTLTITTWHQRPHASVPRM